MFVTVRMGGQSRFERAPPEHVDDYSVCVCGSRRFPFVEFSLRDWERVFGPWCRNHMLPWVVGGKRGTELRYKVFYVAMDFAHSHDYEQLIMSIAVSRKERLVKTKQNHVCVRVPRCGSVGAWNEPAGGCYPREHCRCIRKPCWTTSWGDAGA